MTDIAPPWISVARSFLGVEEVDGAGNNPTILGFVAKIAAVFPVQAKYASNYKSDDIAWCGVFAARCLADVPISGPYDPSDDLHSWMWADAWMTWGVKSEPRIGAILCFGRHVAFLNRIIDADTYEVIGGNQSSPQGGAVTLSKRSASDVKAIRWPAESVIVAPPSQPPSQPPSTFQPLDQRTIDAITTAAAASELARYSWNDRGRGPIGYIKGMAVTYGVALRKLAARDSAALAMVRVVDGPGDVFDHYEDVLKSKGIVTLDAPEIDRLRALWVILTGLGMRESSGNYSEGRDMSASNTSAGTAEAGLFQMSWNAHTTSPEIPKLFAAYGAGKYPDFLEIFREGVRAKEADNFGDGDGREFQVLAKSKPAFAVECAAIGLRTLYTHWGPIIRREAEVRPEADALFRQVQALVLPLDGEILPPIGKLDDDLLNLVFVISQEGDTMDAALQQQILAEIRKASPPNKTLLLQALGGTPTVPGPVITQPPPLGGLDIQKLLPVILGLLSNPTIKKVLGGQPVALPEITALIPTVLAMMQGQTPPPIVPVPEPPTTPPTIGGMSPPAFNWSAGIGGMLTALLGSGVGLMGNPIPGTEGFSVPALITAAAPLIAGAFGVPAPLVSMIGNIFKGKKS